MNFLKDVNPERKNPVAITFPVKPHQLSALVILANYGRNSFDNVIVQRAAGCQVMGILTYKQISENPQRAVIGLTDISTRKNVKRQLGNNTFTFTVPYKMFMEMEENVEVSFLQGHTGLVL